MASPANTSAAAASSSTTTKHGLDLFRLMFADTLFGETTTEHVKVLLSAAYQTQQELGTAGNIHIFVDRPARCSRGLSIGASACVLFSTMISTTDGPVVNQSLSLLGALRGLREEFTTPHTTTWKPTSGTARSLGEGMRSNRGRPRPPVAVVDAGLAGDACDESNSGGAGNLSPRHSKPDDQEFLQLDNAATLSRMSAERDQIRENREQQSILDWFPSVGVINNPTNVELRVSDRALSVLSDVDDKDMSKLYRRTLHSLRDEVIKHTPTKPQKTVSFEWLTPPWLTEHIRSSMYDVELRPVTLEQPYLGKVENMRILLAAFIDNEPLTHPIVSKEKEDMAKSHSPFVKSNPPPPAPPTPPQSAAAAAAAHVKTKHVNQNDIENKKDTPSDQPQVQQQQQQQNPQTPRPADVIPTKKRSTPPKKSGATRDTGGRPSSSRDPKKRRTTTIVTRSATSAKRDSVEQPTNTTTPPSSAASPHVTVLCANGMQCRFAHDQSAQDVNFITGTCSECKRQLHDMCGGRETGDDPLLCAQCKESSKDQ